MGIILETVVVGSLEVNCYVVAKEKNSTAIVIDPGDDLRKIKKSLDKYGLTAAAVINTHAHYDHIGCDDEFGAPVYVHQDDLALLRDPMLNLSGFFSCGYSVKGQIRTVTDGQLIEESGISLRVLHIPGHSPGGMALYMENPKEDIVFTGDCLFREGIGRTDFTGGSEKSLIKGIKEKLFILPDKTVVYPGHGASSTIAYEKTHNPYL
ncbi:MAG: MBL fold metallo-hydrolase [Candidatus Omnitrophica bacterium]|jgi:glyoxylase-like metal-dependent hydrolase (beta-lactamase superfamily II)|nr:MBL fold metallo-hydrolase [Candidatus Omnitrophota bacterium]